MKPDRRCSGLTDGYGPHGLYCMPESLPRRSRDDGRQMLALHTFFTHPRYDDYMKGRDIMKLKHWIVPSIVATSVLIAGGSVFAATSTHHGQYATNWSTVTGHATSNVGSAGSGVNGGGGYSRMGSANSSVNGSGA